MSKNSEAFESSVAQLGALAPAGFALGLHIRFASAQVMLNTYDSRWVETYTSRGYMLCDPIVSWGFGTEGVSRWSALVHPDPHRVLEQAKEHGLVFGLAVSHGQVNSRTIGGFARSDREFTDAEIASVEKLVIGLHALTKLPFALSVGQVDALRMVAKGYRYSQAAHFMGISESALKARLKAAREQLYCRTVAEAIQRSLELKLI
jgi:LuxR family transcriptional regulator, quorum-sensing system regulator SdiA